MYNAKERTEGAGMGQGVLRIGIVGAGQITRKRHLPGFRAIPGVKVVAVCNQHRESASRVAREFEIPKVFENWEHLVDSSEIDAIVIGTWPYLHCPITLAALDMGKHVLTQARMAMNAREAQRMLDKSRERPHLTAMVVPSPYGLAGDQFMRKLIADGFIRSLREIFVWGLSDELADARTEMGWRQMTKYSGFNMLKLGILHESALRWTPDVTRVIASASKIVARRIDPETGEKTRVGTSDSIQVITDQKDGSVGLYRMSGVLWHNLGMGIALHGSGGTLMYDFERDEIRGAKAREHDLKPIAIPDELRGGWQVESDFIAAIRGEKPVTYTDFTTGVRYMQFTEAVARSSRHQAPVTLPLTEFSNPSL
jgi:predicted dehydrogenase